MRPLLLPAALAALLGAAACKQSTATVSADPSSTTALIPAGQPYITGTVVSRDARFQNAPSARVAVDPKDPPGRSADVLLGSDVVVVWRDGRRASVADVTVGRVVSAWVGATELRSLPPVVDGLVLVIER